MYKKLTVAVAAFGMLGGVALADHPYHWLDDTDMQAEVHTWTSGQAVDPWAPPADFTLAPGQQLPPEAPTHAFTGFDVHPEIGSVEYVMVNGNTVVIDVETREIIAVID